MKNKLLVLVLAVCVALTFTACSNEDEETATKVADDFLTAVQVGDYDSASHYCTDEAYEQTGLDSLAKMDKAFCEALGQKKDDLSKSAQESLDGLSKMFQEDFVESYEITSVEQSTSGYVVKANVTYGFDLNELGDVTVSQEETDEITEGYLEANQDELLEIYKTDGEDAMMSRIISDLMPQFVEKYEAKVQDTGTVDDTIQLIIDKKSGKYIITRASMSGLKPEDKK